MSWHLPTGFGNSVVKQCLFKVTQCFWHVFPSKDTDGVFPLQNVHGKYVSIGWFTTCLWIQGTYVQGIHRTKRLELYKAQGQKLIYCPCVRKTLNSTYPLSWSLVLQFGNCKTHQPLSPVFLFCFLFYFHLQTVKHKWIKATNPLKRPGSKAH